MPKKFDQDAKSCIARLVGNRILTEDLSMQSACQAAVPKLGILWRTARQWTQAAHRERRLLPECLPEDLVAENARLRRKVRELRETNELLKAASAFLHRTSTPNVGNNPVH